MRGDPEAIAALGVVAICVLVAVPETLPPDRRHGGGLPAFAVAGREVLRNRRYVRYVVISGSAMGALFAYVATSAFVLQSMNGISPRRWLGQLRVLALLSILVGVVAIGSAEDLPSLVNDCSTAAGKALLVGATMDYRLAWTLPDAHGAVSGLLGARTFGDLGWWAWIADPTPSKTSVTDSLLLLVAGLGATRTLGRAAWF